MTTDIGESGERSGGRFLRTRIDGTADPSMSSREVAWVDDHVMISAFAFDEPPDDIDLATVQQRLDDHQADVISNRADPTGADSGFVLRHESLSEAVELGPQVRRLEDFEH